MTVYLSWVLSAVTLYVTWAMGRKLRHAWIVSLLSQFGWAVLGWVTGAYGMVALAAVMVGLNFHNWRKWQ